MEAKKVNKNIRKEIRFNPKTIKIAKNILDKFPGEYETFSQLVRSSIHYIYNKRCRDDNFEYGDDGEPKWDMQNLK